MSSEFKDHFSDDSASYALNRPGYPAALFSHLSMLCEGHNLAWDCATGSGQSARQLANHFEQVIATDASEPQIRNACRKSNIQYHVATADASAIAPASLDLVTVAQALHWFDTVVFAREVSRTLKTGGVLCVWTYNLLIVNPAIDALVDHLYHDILAGCWAAERRLVEEGYKSVEFPFHELDFPAMQMSLSWNLPQLLDYLATWSAVNTYREQHGSDPVEQIAAELRSAWGTKDEILTVNWPLSVRAWRKN
jgi:SAM-dependent methyltransferase